MNKLFTNQKQAATEKVSSAENLEFSIFRNKIELSFRFFKLFTILVWACSSSVVYAQLHINGAHSTSGISIYYSDLTFSEKNDAKNGIVIHAGQELIIDEDINFNMKYPASDAEIVVNEGNFTIPGGKLSLINCRLYIDQPPNVNGHFHNHWSGITVHGDEYIDHFDILPDPTQLNNQLAFYGVLNPIHGIVTLMGEVSIENAWVGVKSQNGGIVESFFPDGSIPSAPHFKNCKIGILIDNSESSPSAIRLNGINFNYDDTDPFQAGTFWSGSFHHILIENSKAITIGGCSFSTSSIPYFTGWYNFGTGISIGDNSTAIITSGGNEFDYDSQTGCTVQRMNGLIVPNTFNDLSRGITSIHFSNYKFAENVSIDYCEFNNVVKAIEMEVNVIAIHNNIFQTSDYNFDNLFFDVLLSQDIQPIYLKNCTEALIYSNQIYHQADETIYSDPLFACIHIENMGSHQSLDGKLLIQNNIIEGDDNNDHRAEYGIYATGNLKNLEWRCNTFTGNEIDIHYSGVGPRFNPFYDRNAIAGNNYSGSVTHISNNTGISVEYNIPNDVPYPTKIGDVEFNPIHVIGEVHCDLKCSDIPDIRNRLDDGVTSIDVFEKSGLIQMYPNPANSRLYIQNNTNFEKIELEIYNLNGQIVSNHNLVASTAEIDVSDLQIGLYFVHIKYDNFVITKKLLIAR